MAKMTREQFIKKYALGPGGTFLADDKGGNSASEVAGQSVADYYDTYLADGVAPRTMRTGADGSTDEVPWNWGGGTTRDGLKQQIGLDAWSNVDPHPESNQQDGWNDAWQQIGKPIAMGAAMYSGIGALNGMAGAGAAGASEVGATATPVTGGGGAVGTALPSTGAMGGTTGAVGASELAAGGLGTATLPTVTVTGSAIPATAGLSAGQVAGLGASGLSAVSGTPTTQNPFSDLEGQQMPNVETGPSAGDLESLKAAKASGMPYADLVKKYGPTAVKMLLAGGASALANDGGSSGSTANGANVDSLISHAFGNTQSMESDYNTVFKPWATEQVGKITARSDAGYDTLMGLAGAKNKNLDSFQTYVERVGSQGYRDQQRGQAMGEVQQQSDMGLASARRAAIARGIDPSKFALQANANSINTAAAKTKAAGDAEGLAWEQYGRGAQTASGMQLADTNTRANLVTGANGLASKGLEAGTRLATVDGAYRGGLSSAYNQTLGTVTGATNSANQQSNYDKEHGLSGIVNAGLATAATKWLTSDDEPKVNKNIITA